MILVHGEVHFIFFFLFSFPKSAYRKDYNPNMPIVKELKSNEQKILNASVREKEKNETGLRGPVSSKHK